VAENNKSDCLLTTTTHAVVYNNHVQLTARIHLIIQ